MKRTLIILLFALPALLACRPAAPSTTTTTTTELPTPPTATTVVSSTTAIPASEAAGQVSIFDTAPDDRSIYAGGLVAAEQAALDELPGAPVYHMEIAIAESMDALDGRQTVTFTNREDVTLDEVYFHLHARTLEGAITVTDVTVDDTPVEPDARGDALRVPLPSPLPPGEMITIDMRFSTAVPTDIGRNYGVLAYFQDILALAHFYPMLAVYDDEGWNITAPDIQGDLTYSDAAFYLVRVTAPADTVLVGAGEIVEQESGDGRQTITYALGPARDFYLVAGDFIAVSDTVGETTINSYAPADLADGAAMALDVAAAALAGANERLSPYPYTELDIVTTPTSALGIEYPGIIAGTVRMYDVNAMTGSGVPFGAILESTTAHEVAHQWFYNLIGNDQLDEPWLDEAIVSYLTYRYYVDRYGQEVGDGYFENFYGRWNQVNQAEIPIGMPVAAYDGGEYGAIVYGRGAIFIRELEEMMGRATFDAFLHDYSVQFRWREPDAGDFRALAEGHCACDLGPLFEAWVYR